MAGFYMYIGPNIKGVIHSGVLFREGETPVTVANAVKRNPKLNKLIVPDEELPAARIQVKTPGTDLYRAYQALSRKKGG